MSSPSQSPVARLADFVRDPRHGPLPALLLLLTVTTGLVDAVSILSLGRVFVANMTGNVVFVGFALAGAPGFSLSASLIALVGFLVGAGASGPVVERLSGDRGRLLAVGTAVEGVLLAAAALLLALSARPYGAASRDVVVAMCAVALGVQNTAVRKLAVPDFTTTVLTMTLTGIAADLHTARGRGAVVVRRISSVLAMLAGAFAGAELVVHDHTAAAMSAAAALVAATFVTLVLATRRDAGWRRPT